MIRHGTACPAGDEVQLNMSTCFGPARRVVLDQLENRYKRRFCNHWAFVRYAEEAGLNLDFTTPPKRPNRTLTWPEEARSVDGIMTRR